MNFSKLPAEYKTFCHAVATLVGKKISYECVPTLNFVFMNFVYMIYFFKTETSLVKKPVLQS